MKSKKPAVFIIDDDPAVRRHILQLMNSIGFKARAFASPEEFLNRTSLEEPSCMILDVRLPGQSGLELQKHLLESGVHIPIVFITRYASIDQSVRAMRAGAVDFLEKPVKDQDLIDAVNRAIEIGKLSGKERAALKEISDRVAALTSREYEIFIRIVSGLSNKETAAELGLSERTVKIHRASVMKKTNAKTFADLVRMAERLKLLTRQTTS